MSIFSQLKSGQINFGQAVAKVVPFIASVLGKSDAGAGTATPTPPAPVDGSPGQVETVKGIVEAAVHQYLVAKLGDGVPEHIVEGLVDGLLNSLSATITAALHGAAAKDAPAG